jgi:hypothetical protein
MGLVPGRDLAKRLQHLASAHLIRLHRRVDAHKLRLALLDGEHVGREREAHPLALALGGGA